MSLTKRWFRALWHSFLFCEIIPKFILRSNWLQNAWKRIRYDRIEFNLCIYIIHRTSSIPSYPVIVNIQNYRTVWKTYLLKQIFIFIIVNFNPDTFFKQVPLSCLLKTYFLQFINTKIISNSFYNRMCCME